MIFFWLASVLFVIVLAILFRTERMMLHEGRARSRALVMDGVRLAAVAAMFFALPAAQPRPLATIGLGLAAFAFIAVPSSWMLAIGGIDPKWELRRIQAECAALMARYPSPMPPDGAAEMRRIVRYVEPAADGRNRPAVRPARVSLHRLDRRHATASGSWAGAPSASTTCSAELYA